MRAPILDQHIRAALKAFILSTDPHAVIYEELPLLRGCGRADIVSVNGVIAAFEIKSERDSLTRLETQVPQYASAFEYNTVVVANRHLKAARAKVPRTWGLAVAEMRKGKLCIRNVRRAMLNRCIDRQSLTRLLWKQECVRALSARGVKVNRNAPVVELWEHLEQLPSDSLCGEVRRALKARRASESADSRTLDGD